MNKFRSFITIKGTFIALHCWPEAPDAVAFLRYPHRHVFFVEVDFPVEHGDRHLEFFLTQNGLNQRLVKELQPRLNANMQMSCEHMAQFLHDSYTARPEAHGIVPMRVMVSEDGENSATVIRE